MGELFIIRNNDGEGEMLMLKTDDGNNVFEHKIGRDDKLQWLVTSLVSL